MSGNPSEVDPRYKELNSSKGQAFKEFHRKSFEAFLMSEPDGNPNKYILEDFFDLAKKKWAMVSMPRKATFLELSKKNTKKEKKAAKDPNAPKKAMSSFMFFAQDCRRRMEKDSTPSTDAPKQTVGEHAKIMGKKWKELGQEEKEVYIKMANQDRARYQEEMKSYAGASKIKTQVIL